MDITLYAILKNKITEIRQKLLKVVEDAADMNSRIVQNTNNIANKLDKNQGMNNSGKIAGINESGDIVPMFPQGVTYDEETQCLKYGVDEKLNLNAGIQLDATLSKVGYAADAAAAGKAIDELKTDLETLFNIKYTLIVGKYINSSSGKAVSFSGYQYTDFVNITGLKKIVVGISVSTNNVGLAFYSEQSESSFVSGVNYGDFSLGAKAEINIPNNAKFVRACLLTSNIDKFGIWAIDIISALNNHKSEISDARTIANEAKETIDDVAAGLALNVGKEHLTNGYYVRGDDKNVGGSYADFNASDYIPIGKRAVVHTALADSAVLIVLDTNKNVTRYITDSNDKKFADYIIEAEQGEEYIRTSCYTRYGSIDDFNVKSYVSMIELSEKVNNAISLSVPAYTMADKALSGTADALALDIGELVDGFVNSAYGHFVEATSYKRTDYIPIIGGAVDVCVTYNVDNVGLAFYDKNKIYIEGHDYEGHAYGDIVRVEVPQNAKYLAYCAINSQKDNMKISYPQLAKSIIPIITNDAKNPCEYTDSKECMVFNKILCIGDSLTDGQFDYKVDGVTKEFNDKRYAYPTYLKALCGRDITNVGDAGESTVSWFEKHGTEDFSGHDACIIALGRNDERAKISTEDRINAMNNIIAKVKADNPQIKIFICTQINYYHYSIVDTINTDMATVAEQNTDCYLLDIHKYGSMVFSTDAHSHCTAVGYYKLAQEIFNYISYVIHENPTEFKTIQFAGTDRSY